jgi:rare lipoprotein A
MDTLRKQNDPFPTKAADPMAALSRSRRVRRMLLNIFGMCFLAAVIHVASLNASGAIANAQTGVASIYSTESGSQTASGARLNPGALTAAHRTLPFGSKVRVTNRSNGRSVVVTVNDRGPFVRGRIIDVTPAAAHALGFSGLAPVTVQRE